MVIIIMVIGFTGTQIGMTKYQKDQVLNILKLKQCTEFCQGDCIGSDDESVDIAIEAGVRIFSIFPPDNSTKRVFRFDPEKLTKHITNYTGWLDRSYIGILIKVRWFPVEPYLERNKKIVNNCAFMIATPKGLDEEIRSGTWQTIRYAWKIKRDITIISPYKRTEENKITSQESKS